MTGFWKTDPNRTTTQSHFYACIDSCAHTLSKSTVANLQLCSVWFSQHLFYRRASTAWSGPDAIVSPWASLYPPHPLQIDGYVIKQCYKQYWPLWISLWFPVEWYVIKQCYKQYWPLWMAVWFPVAAFPNRHLPKSNLDHVWHPTTTLFSGVAPFLVATPLKTI